MSNQRTTTLACLALVFTAGRAAASFPQTYIEPTGVECGSGALIAPAALGQAPLTTIGPDLDGDGFGGSNEDSDADAVFATLSVAISNTAAGGIVNIMGPGACQVG